MSDGFTGTEKGRGNAHLRCQAEKQGWDGGLPRGQER